MYSLLFNFFNSKFNYYFNENILSFKSSNFLVSTTVKHFSKPGYDREFFSRLKRSCCIIIKLMVYNFEFPCTLIASKIFYILYYCVIIILINFQAKRLHSSRFWLWRSKTSGFSFTNSPLIRFGGDE